jgi:tetratricopeptide (TPR) repeat protein
VTLKYLLLFVFLSYSVRSVSQNEELLKKMKQELATAKEGEKFRLLSDIAWEYRSSHPDSSIFYATKAYALGQSINVKKGLARPLNFIGLASSHSGDHLDAFESYNEAVAVASRQNDSLQLAHAYNNIGRLFTEQGLFQKARPYFSKSLTLFSGIKDSSGVAYTYQSIGALDKLQNEFSDAEVNYLNAYTIRLKLKSHRETLSAMIQLGKLYMDQNITDKAIHYFGLADSTGKAIHDGIGIAEVKTLMAECLISKGELARAEKIGKEGLDYILHSSNIRLLPGAYLTMGRIQFEKGNWVEAKHYFEKALEISAMRKDLNSRLEAHFFLWQTYRQQRNVHEELISHNEYLVVKDSLKSLEMIQKQQKFNFEMQIERQEKENELLKAAEERQNAIILVLIVMLFSASWLLYAQWKHRKRIQRFSGRLEERNNDIKKINELLNLKNTTLENHISTLLEFSKNRNIVVGDLMLAARDIVMTTAKNLQLSRVSIWTYDDTCTCINLMVGYELDSQSQLPPMTIHLNDAPGYFNALKKEKMIVAYDAMTNEFTKEFKDTYLEPLHIQSMLDATFFLDGELKGLICCEQQHEPRNWSAEDIIFVSSVSDIISLAFRTAQRLEYEKQIKLHSRQIERMNELLEDRVRERTEELEVQNLKLAEYAFINSHLLRGPLSRILGLINLMEHDRTMKHEDIVDLLRRSGTELDTVVHRITDTLQHGGHLNREDIAS